MHIGSARLTLRLPGNDSLKGKRHVAKSLVTRLRQRYNLSISEVDTQDAWQTLVLGVACVGINGGKADSTLDRVIAFIEASRLDVELIDVQREVAEGP